MHRWSNFAAMAPFFSRPLSFSSTGTLLWGHRQAPSAASGHPRLHPSAAPAPSHGSTAGILRQHRVVFVSILWRHRRPPMGAPPLSFSGTGGHPWKHRRDPLASPRHPRRPPLEAPEPSHGSTAALLHQHRRPPMTAPPPHCSARPEPCLNHLGSRPATNQCGGRRYGRRGGCMWRSGGRRRRAPTRICGDGTVA